MTAEPGAVRAATHADLAAVAGIYAHYVLHTHVTFDLDPPPLEVWATRLPRAGAIDGFLVAEAAGEVVGFAYSGAFRPKAAYVTTRETTVYVAPGHGGRGLGRQLYDELLAGLDARGALVAVANLAEPNPASAALHRACGFSPVGTLVGVGVKFGAPRDVTLWQRPRGE